MIKKIFALPVIEQISPVLSRRKLDELDLIVVDPLLHYRAHTFSRGNLRVKKKFCG